jgi:integrase/recombinase XerD
MQGVEVYDLTTELDLYVEDNGLLGLVYGWLLTVRSRRSREAYANDLGFSLRVGGDGRDLLVPRQDNVGWLPFLVGVGVEDPTTTTRKHVDGWVEMMRTGTSGVPSVAEKTIARRVSAVSSWYEYLLTLDEAPANPVKAVKRPRIDPDFSPTFGPDKEQAKAVMRTAREHGTTAEVLVSLMLHSGLRSTETVALDMPHVTEQNGHRVVRIIGKGDKPAFVPLSPPTAAAVNRLRVNRAERLAVDIADLAGPLLLDQNGKRLTRQAAADLIGRLGRRAGLPRELTPHGLRHAFVTLGLDAGVSLRRMQDSARHKDPRTTRRYDRNRNQLDEHAAYAVAAYLADGE